MIVIFKIIYRIKFSILFRLGFNIFYLFSSTENNMSLRTWYTNANSLSFCKNNLTKRACNVEPFLSLVKPFSQSLNHFNRPYFYLSNLNFNVDIVQRHKAPAVRQTADRDEKSITLR